MQQVFARDTFSPGEEANARLAYLLTGPWAALPIVKIERLTNTDPALNGWQAYY